MVHLPNRRCRRARDAGLLRKFIHEVARHANRLECWVRGGKDDKWPRWGTVLCEYHVQKKRSINALKSANALFLLDHHRERVYNVFERWGVDDICHPWYEKQHRPLRHLGCKAGSHRYPTYWELMDLEHGDKILQLGPIYSISDMEHHQLKDLNIESTENYGELEMLALFNDRIFLPPHFPKDFEMTWMCQHCDKQISHDPHCYEDGRDRWLCDDCYYAGLCGECDCWSEPDNMKFFSHGKTDKSLCEDCYGIFYGKLVHDPLEEYLIAEREGAITRPLEHDWCWQELREALTTHVKILNDVDGDVEVRLENPEELVDEAIVLSKEHGSFFNGERIPWYDRKGWSIWKCRLTSKPDI